jgi:transglutaminase-like putative cysteine protease
MPQWVARLVPLAALAAIGAGEWQDLVRGLSAGRVLTWVLASVLAALAVLLVTRPPSTRPPSALGWVPGRRGRSLDEIARGVQPREPRLPMPDFVRAFLLTLIVLAAIFAGYALSGAPLELLKPRRWDDLLSGLAGGLQALGTVRLPYRSADPWPRIVLELLGSEMLILAGLLTFWPRASGGRVQGSRVAMTTPERGYPFVALAVLIVVIASPVISLGGPRSVLLGLAVAALSICFLWLEQLPLRPGLGVAGLLLVALVGALPVAGAADRGQPWFDYRAFAESLGPDDPVRFSWTQSYGPIDWPREGNEVFRVVSGEPLYWKARNLDDFNGVAWQVSQQAPQTSRYDKPYEADLPEDWRTRPAWLETVQVNVKRMRTTDVIGSGTTVSIKDPSRSVRPALSPGTWDAPSALRRNDSYTAEVHVPRPGIALMSAATTGEDERQRGERVLTVGFKPGEFATQIRGAFSRSSQVTDVELHFAPFGSTDSSYAAYPSLNRSEPDVDAVMERTKYARTWRKVQGFVRGAEHPMDVIRKVDDYLRGGQFRYSERPPRTPVDQAPLDYFINVSKVGYCQHFAGAMALMLRMAGIPARVATGFTPGGYSSRHKAWIVRDTDAHAWVEVWFDKYGWVAIDPTPPATPARSQVASLAAAPTSAPVTPDRDNGQAGAEDSDPNPISVRPELQLGRNDDQSGTVTDPSGWNWLMWFLAVVIIAGLALAVLLFLRRPRGKTPMDRAIYEVEDAMRRVGRPVTTGTTLIQLERRLGSHSPEVSAYLRALASGRYGPVSDPPPRSGRRALRRALAQGLGFGGGLRALWALPPRIDRTPREPRSREIELELSVRG